MVETTQGEMFGEPHGVESCVDTNPLEINAHMRYRARCHCRRGVLAPHKSASVATAAPTHQREGAATRGADAVTVRRRELRHRRVVHVIAEYDDATRTQICQRCLLPLRYESTAETKLRAGDVIVVTHDDLGGIVHVQPVANGTISGVLCVNEKRDTVAELEELWRADQ